MLVAKPDGYVPPRLRCGHVVPAHVAIKEGTAARITVDCTVALLAAAAAVFDAPDDGEPQQLWLRATVGRVRADSGCAVSLVRSAPLELTAARMGGHAARGRRRASVAVTVELDPSSLCDKDGRTANRAVLQVDAEVAATTLDGVDDTGMCVVPTTFVNVATLRSPEFAVTIT